MHQSNMAANGMELKCKLTRSHSALVSDPNGLIPQLDSLNEPIPAHPPIALISFDANHVPLPGPSSAHSGQRQSQGKCVLCVSCMSYESGQADRAVISIDLCVVLQERFALMVRQACDPVTVL